MINKKTRKGMGEFQTRTKIKNRENIFKLLIDNGWHEYREIKQKTHLSNPTLSGHLKQLKPLLARKEDRTTYPHPVSYKIKPLFALELARGLVVEVAWKEIEEQLLKTKDWKSALESIDLVTNSLLMTIMSGLIVNEDLREDSETVYLLLETFVWESYKTLTWKFIESNIKNLMKA